MLGYICKVCDELITIRRPGLRRDCPHCKATAYETVLGKAK